MIFFQCWVVFITFITINLAFDQPIQPLFTIDKTKKIQNLKSLDTCFLEAPECDPNNKYRTIDGSCNNLDHPTWGMLGSAFVRLFKPRYSDGIELPPLAVDGSELPNARKIVTSVFSDRDAPDNISLIVAQWAQFVAHDFAAAVNKQGADNCCDSDNPLICLPITIPEDDIFYSQYNITCLAVTRTATTVCGDCSDTDPKIQVNGVTHGLDGSQIYGSDEDTASSLREYVGGRLLVRKLEDGRCFLPSKGSCYNSDVCYIAGESRVNQNTQLTVMHTMLVRYHNIIADALAALHSEWDDETLYQEARRIVIAVYQHITYTEFLPNILSEEIIKNNFKSQYSYQYDPDIPNVVVISFSNPVFRIFHSALQGVIGLYSYHLNPTSFINLTDYMNSPGILEQENHFDELILGVITQPTQSFDEFYTAQIEGKLFHMSRPYGTDLNALDIQRARDHGVPGYPTVLNACTGLEVNSFEDLAELWPAEKVELIQQIYKNVDDIDLFIGINFENKNGRRLSPVTQCLISEQFYRWKMGDRFWYENEGQPNSFTTEQIEEIKKVSFSRLVCDTSDYIVNVTKNAWTPPSENNPVVPCETIPNINLSKWS